MTTLQTKITDPAVRSALKGEHSQMRDPRWPLYLRIHKRRKTASWYLREYRNGGETWHPLGVWPRLTAKVLIPQMPGRVAALSLPEANPVDHWSFTSELLTWYRDRQQTNADLSVRTKANLQSVIDRHLIPRVGGLRLEHIDRAQLDEKLVQSLQAELSASYVQQCFSALKAAFSQARDLELIAINPLAEVRLKDFGKGRPAPKPGQLKAQHLSKLWQAFGAAAMPPRLLSLLQLLHGTRINETRLMRWGWIDFETGQIEIPGAVTKNGNALVLPLTDHCRLLLQAYRRWQAQRGYSGGFLFPGQKPRQPISERTALQWCRDLSGGEWSSHDLRKLARTSWTDLGIDHYVGEALINHSVSVLEATYIQTELARQKREALNRWHSHLIERGCYLITEGEGCDAGAAD